MVQAEARGRRPSCFWVTRKLAPYSWGAKTDGEDRMGGLLIADAALDVAKNTRDGDPMWPKIVAILGELTWFATVTRQRCPRHGC